MTVVIHVGRKRCLCQMAIWGAMCRGQFSSRYQRTTVPSLSSLIPANGRTTRSTGSLEVHCFWEALSW
uniref:Uncharacterized protein n=1 Tax=Arundo donax TaxID=35708 RepID=A0A0A9HL78_ARUDO